MPRWLLSVFLPFAFAGCDSGELVTHPAGGRVVLAGGESMMGAIVEFQAMEGPWKGRNARAEIREDGTFVLTTETAGDGAVAGRHRAIVHTPPVESVSVQGDPIPPPIIHSKYQDYGTSGLEFVVKPEETNDFTIELMGPS